MTSGNYQPTSVIPEAMQMTKYNSQMPSQRGLPQKPKFVKPPTTMIH